MNEKIKLVEEHMMSSYKEQMIMSDMVAEVITHDSYDRFLFKPSQIEVNWLVAKLRFNIADELLKEEVRKQDEAEWMNWIYGK